MKNNIDLHDEFVDALFRKEPKRAELVKLVASVLKIEKEPASRRLNKTVLFSVREMGLLVRELNLSVDSLLHKDSLYQMTPILLEKPMSLRSMDDLGDVLELHVNNAMEIVKEDSELGSVFDTLPFELLTAYPELLKFSLFSLGHYFIPSGEFDRYGEWEVPLRLIELFKTHEEHVFENIHDFTYIWNDTLIWHFVRKLNYFYAMHVINQQDRELIIGALHAMLTDLEARIRSKADDPRVAFYIANVNMGMTAWYHISPVNSSALLRSNFCVSALIRNREYCEAIKEWILSLRSLSTLISGSGHKERRLFFDEQHKIIDNTTSGRT